MCGSLNNNQKQMKIKEMKIRRIQVIIKLNWRLLNKCNYPNMINNNMNKKKHNKL